MVEIYAILDDEPIDNLDSRKQMTTPNYELDRFIENLRLYLITKFKDIECIKFVMNVKRISERIKKAEDIIILIPNWDKIYQSTKRRRY
jgi:isoprenylcysteine carboxyl methyltransferase (ICMT) family protein YpbQ